MCLALPTVILESGLLILNNTYILLLLTVLFTTSLVKEVPRLKDYVLNVI